MSTTVPARSEIAALTWPQTAGWIITAVACFHLAYQVPVLSCLISVYVLALVQLAKVATARIAFYGGWFIGVLIFAPQLLFMADIFGPLGFVLWLIGAIWTAAFVLISHVTLKRYGTRVAIFLWPTFWLGLEYFRSELYWLRFSWLIPGYTFAGHGQPLLSTYVGVYGVGFLFTLVAVALWQFKARTSLIAGSALLLLLGLFANVVGHQEVESYDGTEGPVVAGIQMEFPFDTQVLATLDQVVESHPECEIIVLSEYTLSGPVPEEILVWCKDHQRYLVIGGKDPLPETPSEYFNTAFVVSPQGKVVFKQGKSVPIQMFKDGLPATEQRLWNSPWGKVGICICYDLSYSRVVDRLVRQGAQMLIVPTMDVQDWGKHEHQLHSKVAPSRSAEYGVPIVRVCSSGISQLVNSHGRVTSALSFPGQEESFCSRIHLVPQGRIPLDRYLAPIAVVVTIGSILYLWVSSLRFRRTKS